MLCFTQKGLIAMDQIIERLLQVGDLTISKNHLNIYLVKLDMDDTIIESRDYKLLYVLESIEWNLRALIMKECNE